VLEFEQLLKVFFADYGTKTDALQAIATIQAWARERNQENIAVARSYVKGAGPFPKSAAVLGIVGRFHTDFADMVAAWANWAANTTDGWPDEPRHAEPDWEFMKQIAKRARVNRGSPPSGCGLLPTASIDLPSDRTSASP